MGYRDYPTKVPVDPKEKEMFMRKLGLEHLKRVWQWFEIYHLNPYVPPYFSLPKEAYQKEDEEGEGGEGGDGFKIFDIERGFKVYDFGDYLATSAGDEYGPLALGRLYRTVNQMMDLLEKRGAEEIAFGEGCIEPAKIYGWQQASLKGMKVFGYNPTEEYIDRLEKTYGALGITMEEIAKPE